MDASHTVFANLVTVLTGLEQGEGEPLHLREDVAQALLSVLRRGKAGRVIKLCDREPSQSPHREMGVALAA